ncbi:Uncharacterised protein [Mycobacteroides abscessus subsp. abscessus]|nr:Uncharacterised protein [Mycobacteroides abscessus subsp. abscessus]
MGNFVNLLQEALLWFNNPEISYDRLDQHCCDLVSPFSHRFFKRLDIIEWDRDHFLGDAFRHAGRIRCSKCGWP